MKSNEISDILLKEYYPKGRNYCVTNFTGSGLHECDILMVTKSLMVYEYEIKCSTSDFRADFNKYAKHLHLSGQDKQKDGSSSDLFFLKHTPTAGRPNYFYYACEPGIIPENEIPSYAGLVHILPKKVVVIKKAPKLHKHKCKPELIEHICRNLTARMIYGCSFMNFKNKFGSLN